MSNVNTHRLPHGDIMVVEDNAPDLKLLSEILTKAGYRVRPASDGELALRSVRAKLPDLILLDINLPGMNGVEVCRRLKADPGTRDIPVIFISALGETDLKVKAFEGGGIDYVTKPFEFSEVLARINTHLNMHRLQRRLAVQSEELIAEIEERKRAEEQIKASLKEKEVLLREIHHRVKNNMQVIISLLKLQSDKVKDKQYIDMFQDSQDRIKTMSLVHEQLYQTKDFANIDFGEHVERLVNGLFGSYGIDTNKVSLNIDIKDVSIDLENAIPCGLIITELVSNSLKYAFPQGREGEISIALRPFNEDELELTVSDDGIGVPEDLDIKQTDTMGLQLVKMLSENQLDGKIDLDRTGGTQFNIKFKSTTHKPRI